MNRNFFLVGLLFAILPTSTFAQKQRSQAFKEKYILKEAVILSRHNIRAPLSTKGSLLEKVTTHPWFEWTAGASELTTRAVHWKTNLAFTSANGWLMLDCLEKTPTPQPTK